LWAIPTLAPRHESSNLQRMLTVTEIQSALEKLPREQVCQVADWIDARELPDETTEQLAAIDAGLSSLTTEPPLTAEDVRKNIRTWATR
jgi:hypothetical protein